MSTDFVAMLVLVVLVLAAVGLVRPRKEWNPEMKKKKKKRKHTSRNNRWVLKTTMDSLRISSFLYH